MTPSAPWPRDATHDQLVGDWHLWQRRGGHRTSTDDLLTAGLAVSMWRQHRGAGGHDTPPALYVDLGCGIGSVLLLVAHALRPTLSVGVEAQAQSATMAAGSVAGLSAAPPIEVWHGDLRAVVGTSLPKVPLITGSPPYLPEGSGVLPADVQRRACRFELRGGVEAYCASAASLLSPEGHFVLVFQTLWQERVLRAAQRAGLAPRSVQHVWTRADRPAPFLSVFALQHADAAPTQPSETRFAVRDDSGAWTEAYKEIRATLALSTA